MKYRTIVVSLKVEVKALFNAYGYILTSSIYSYVIHMIFDEEIRS
jgi:hypothetical protein